ncbi:MAG TPA: carbamoyltransferase HypF [Acetobacteraceae bacterium]|nr:carbamoyltransferase HypF [Acetobacteraceae bacterium]
MARLDDLLRHDEDCAAQLRVRGLVQGVGLRPTVWRLARQHGLRGWVGNDGAGVTAMLCGAQEAISSLVEALRRAPPPLARIDAIELVPIAVPPDCTGFRINESHADAVHTGVVPDAAACPACLAEILDPASRRYRYPFANCTHCGPRLSIIEAIPYDRGTTTMRAFGMCAACAAEYRDPADRRFHAQPIACAACGPQAWLEPARVDADAIDAARTLLLAGGIVAVKALGGFHLACDATDAAAVARLRQAKRRDAKPFALMARDLDVIRRYAVVTDADAAALGSVAAPIVVLEARGLGWKDTPPPLEGGGRGEGCVQPLAGGCIDPSPQPWSASRPKPPRGGGVSSPAPSPRPPPSAPLPGVAPGLSSLGFMLPSTPLHHLLLHGIDRPLVMTSGNLADEPQCIGNDEALTRLRGIADHVLLHDRDIARRVDDSIARVMGGAARVLRRARGYAPAPLPLPTGFATAPPLLSMGGELKNTFALLRDGEALLSHHMGDLENAPTFADYRRSIEQYRALFAHTPRAVAVDCHPDYLSTKHGQALAAQQGLPVIAVQHHHAHLAACLAENAVPLGSAPVLGIVLDGLGWGDDGTIWGGEFLLGDYRGFRRLARLKPVAMPGGAQAIREPWRNAYAHIAAALGWPAFVAEYGHSELADYLGEKPLAVLGGMIARGVNAPLSSSCGRLFDAVAAASGLCRDRTLYEGQAAMMLEAAADSEAADDDRTAYPFTIAEASPTALLHLDPAPMWRPLLQDVAAGTPVPLIAGRFHGGLAIAISRMVAALRVTGRVALSGGVFQNKLLLELVMRRLTAQGLDVLTHRQVPANDGGLALGQAVVAAARMLAGDATGD